jgi:ElaB/YqjD/DUF883 family membrane-anchored ribosome-binding protein
MTDKENRKYQMFVRVRNFCTAHATDFVANSLASQLIAALVALIATLDDLIAEQSSGRGAAREGTSSRGTARAALRDSMEAISRTARTLGQGLDEKFRVPHGQNDQVLIGAARGFARDAAPLSAKFIALELPADFIEELNEDIDDLQSAIDQHTDAVGDHVGARAGIDRAIDEASGIVRQLDTIIRNKYRNDPVVLAEWASASHTERDPKRKPASPTAPAPPANS